MTDGIVSVARRIEAPAEHLFALLADTGNHPALDGSGMVREPSPPMTLTGAGDVFMMKMHNAEMGDYEMANHVVAFEPGRRIGWEPVLFAASRPEDQAEIGDRSAPHRWEYELAPDGPGATLVTETYDCTCSPDWLRKAVRNGERWRNAMSESLDRLAELSRQPAR
jgi:Polyketide cyclase / dehydrase and lipid transport